MQESQQQEFEGDGYTPQDIDLLRPKLQKIVKWQEQRDALQQKVNAELEDCKALGWDKSGLKQGISSAPIDKVKRVNQDRSRRAAQEALGIDMEQMELDSGNDNDEGTDPVH